LRPRPSTTAKNICRFRTSTSSTSASRWCLDFAQEVLPDDVDDVRDIFSKRSAYADFKALIASRGLSGRINPFDDTLNQPSRSFGNGAVR
jgi:hypothetical protein